MKIVEQSFKFLDFDSEKILQTIENAGRVCYKSIPQGDPVKFIQNLINTGHLSVLEHSILTAKLTVNRGILGELTRHRLNSFSVESSRYCNYSKDKFDGEVKFILPLDLSEEQKEITIEAYKFAEKQYLAAIAQGMKPEQARDLLPMGLATELYTSANLRQWIYLINLRTSTGAHPQIAALMNIAKKQLQNKLPLKMFKE